MNTRQMVTAISSVVLKLVLSIAVVVLVYKGAVMAYDYGYHIFQEPPVAEAPGYDIEVQITMGKSAREIGELLEQKGLIRDGTLFYIQNLLSHYNGDLKPGVYTLNTAMTMQEMMEVMSAGDAAAENTGDTE